MWCCRRHAAAEIASAILPPFAAVWQLHRGVDASGAIVLSLCFIST
jgi:hypothetical protein